MKAGEFITEIGDSPAKHEPNRRRRRSLFHATVNGQWVDVFFDRSDLNGTLHITFAVNNNYDAPRQPTRASGSTVRILSTVLDIIRRRLPEYMRTARPPAVSFTAKEDSRTRLYRKYFVPVVQDILGPKWQLTEYPNMGMTVFNWRPVKQDRSEINEIGAPGELDVSEKLQRYFTDRGYDIEGEGRDQMVFHKPGQRHVIKIIGLGDNLDRRDSVADYVRFFAMNQNDPHYPRVSPPREIQVGDEIYTIYRQELLQSLPGEERVMDWMEKFGAALGDPARARAWMQENPLPAGLPKAQIRGLYRAVRRLQQFYGDDLGGSIRLDLGHVGNFMQRADGTIVVVDPLTYDESYDTYSESATDVTENFADGKVKEMAPPPISVKSATLYHGTPTLNNAQGIMRNGLKFDPELIAQKYQGSENFAPLPGVYLSKDFGNAVRYSFMSSVPDEQYAEYIKQEPYGYVFEFSGQNLSQTSPDEDELGQLLEKFVKAKNLPPKLSALIQGIPENLKSQLSQPDVSFETIAVAGKWLVSKLKPQTLQYLMQRYINVVNYGIMKPVAVWKIPKPEQRFLRDRQGTFDTLNGYINWANRYGKKQKLEENFADGKKPGRKGLSRRVGIPKKATLGQLEKIAKSSTGERRRMAQWQLNMRRGRARKNKS